MPCIHFGHKTKGLAHSLLKQPQGHAFPSNSKAHNHFKSHAKNHPFHQKQSINSHAKPPLTHMHPNKANLANPTCILYATLHHSTIHSLFHKQVTCISTFLLHHFTTFSLFNSFHYSFTLHSFNSTPHAPFILHHCNHGTFTPTKQLPCHGLLIFPFPFQHLTCISTFLLHHFTTFSLLFPHAILHHCNHKHLKQIAIYISTPPINTLAFIHSKIISFTTQQHTTNTFLSPLESKNHLPFPPILIHFHNSPTLPSPQPTYP